MVYVRTYHPQTGSAGSVLGTTILVVLVALVAAGAAVYFVTPARHSSRPSTHHPKTPSTTNSLPNSTTTTTVPSSTTTGGGSPGNNNSSSSTRCTASQLALSHAAPNIAAGTVGQGFTLKNVSSTVCMIDGYPDMQLYNSSGQPMQTTVVRNGGYGFTSEVPTTVTLNPGSSAAFTIGFSAISTGTSNSCPSSAQISVALPQGSFHYPSYLTITDSIAPCNGGQVTVSAIYSGSPRV